MRYPHHNAVRADTGKFRSGLAHSFPGLVLLVIGVVLSLVAGGSTALFAAGLALVGIGAVIIASVFFYEVGRSEDRTRERERPPPHH